MGDDRRRKIEKRKMKEGFLSAKTPLGMTGGYGGAAEETAHTQRRKLRASGVGHPSGKLRREAEATRAWVGR
jgi:hypothetical protein